MNRFSKEIFCFSGIGKRSNNEDSLFPLNPSADDDFFIVCDGVGGNSKGEVASAMCCEASAKIFSDVKVCSEQFISEAFYLVHQKMLAYASENQDAKNMATTIASVFFENNKAWIIHLGDSRVYQIRKGSIIHKTNDHSLVGQLVAEHIITEDEARIHAKKNVITKALAVNRDYEAPTVFLQEDINIGDYFLLCTDGFIEAFTDSEIVDVLNAGMSNAEKIQFFEQKCSMISKDNNTACMVQVVG